MESALIRLRIEILFICTGYRRGFPRTTDGLHLLAVTFTTLMVSVTKALQVPECLFSSLQEEVGMGLAEHQHGP